METIEKTIQKFDIELEILKKRVRELENTSMEIKIILNETEKEDEK